MAKPPSIPQVKARWHSGHKGVLLRLSQGQPIVSPTAGMGEVRGTMTIMETLRRWGAVGPGNVLTDFGQALAAVAQEEEDLRLAVYRAGNDGILDGGDAEQNDVRQNADEDPPLQP